MRRKAYFSILMSFILAMTLLPAAAFAETGTTIPSQSDGIESNKGHKGSIPGSEPDISDPGIDNSIAGGDAVDKDITEEPDLEKTDSTTEGDSQSLGSMTLDNGMRVSEVENATISYRAHVAEIGWMDSVKDGAVAGTTGRALHIEALEASLGSGIEGGLSVEAHVANIGWMDAVGAGEVVGTTGRALQMEAMRMKLTGEAAQLYDIYYRVHSANLGWLGWAMNGQEAGSQGFNYGMEALEIKLVPKGGEAPGLVGDAFKEPIWKVAYAQVGESTNCSVTIPMLDRMLSTGEADSVKLTARMSYNGVLTREVVTTKKLTQELKDGFVLDFKTYGPFSATSEFMKDGKVVGSSSQSVGVSASRYNIAPISATFPVVLFSLSMWDITQSGAIPTIVMLDRPSAYDWDNLPKGTYGMPYLSESAIKSTADYAAFAQYVKDLYALNPKAQFDLYINDITCSLIHSFIYANGIPQGQYKIKLLSDGTASYSFYDEAYSVADPEAKHQQLIDSWNKAKTYAYTTGSVSEDYGWHGHWDSMYAVLDCEPNTEWWVARKDLFTKGGSVLARLKSDVRVIQKSVSGMLGNLSGQGSDVVEEFKNLYNFNDGYFTDAEEQGKEVMVILGTYPEPNLENYIRLVQAYYGDDYLYYYKGHPRTPTGLDPNKQALLDSLGVIDVDSSIAAELILFFNPDIKLSGYDSSTYDSVTNDDMACGLFGLRKEAALSSSLAARYQKMDWFVTPISESTEESIRVLCPEGDTCLLVELAAGQIGLTGFDIGVFNADKNIVSYYAKVEDDYVLKKTVNNAGDIRYSAHVAELGWQGWMKDGAPAGTTGKALSVQALKIEQPNPQFDGAIRYSAHVADIGWQGWVENGNLAGTVGQNKQMEAIRIELTGDLAKSFNVTYRVHVAELGWQEWVENGKEAGTTGRGLGIESIEIKLAAKV